MAKCDYGCGQEAIHQFKNGKWCCSKNISNCPSIKNKISENAQGRIISKEQRKKISEKLKGKKISPKTRVKMSITRKGRKHPNYGKQLSMNTRKKISESHKEIHSIEGCTYSDMKCGGNE